jgi:hypothetical protein
VLEATKVRKPCSELNLDWEAGAWRVCLIPMLVFLFGIKSGMRVDLDAA